MTHLGLDLDSPEYQNVRKRMVEYLRIRLSIEEKYTNAIHNKLSSLTPIEIDAIATKFLEWENKGNRKLQCGNSRLCNYLVETAFKFSDETTSKETDRKWLLGACEYFGYKICVYGGQGSYYVISKINK
jgi:predicted ABC-type ATPase